MSKFRDRLIDLRVAAQRAAAALSNVSGGTWEKFLSDGKPAQVSIDSEGNINENYITKPSDTRVFIRSDVEKLFDREEVAKTYKDSLDKRKPAATTIQAKLESDILSSMQQAAILRYSTSRIRHFCAARSRRQSIGASDAEIIQLQVQKQ